MIQLGVVRKTLALRDEHPTVPGAEAKSFNK